MKPVCISFKCPTYVASSIGYSYTLHEYLEHMLSCNVSLTYKLSSMNVEKMKTETRVFFSLKQEIKYLTIIPDACLPCTFCIHSIVITFVWILLNIAVSLFFLNT